MAAVAVAAFADVADVAAAAAAVAAVDGGVVQLPHAHIAAVNSGDVGFVTSRQAEIAVDEKINVVRKALRVYSYREEHEDNVGFQQT